MKFRNKVIHAGIEPGPRTTGAIMTPIFKHSYGLQSHLDT